MILTAAFYGLERRRWRRAKVRRWKRSRGKGRMGRTLVLLVKLCLLAAILAEACWFASTFVTVERVDEVRQVSEPGPGPARSGRGIRLRLDNGEISLFEVEEHVAAESD